MKNKVVRISEDEELLIKTIRDYNQRILSDDIEKSLRILPENDTREILKIILRMLPKSQDIDFDYLTKSGFMTPRQKDFLISQVSNENIFIRGNTASGKTSLLRLLINETPYRFCIVEKYREIEESDKSKVINAANLSINSLVNSLKENNIIVIDETRDLSDFINVSMSMNLGYKILCGGQIGIYEKDIMTYIEKFKNEFLTKTFYENSFIEVLLNTVPDKHISEILYKPKNSSTYKKINGIFTV